MLLNASIRLIALSSLIFFVGCKNSQPDPEPEKPEIKNVILLIGDGMGIAQVSSSFYFGADKEPNFVRFPVIGLIRTSSAKERITDSAAGATAFASGIKTYNGAIGMDVDQKPSQTMCERLQPQNVATGIIATSSVTHATPACFYAHATLRQYEDSIAAQLPGSGVQFFAGGGLSFFKNGPGGTNIVKALEDDGYHLDTTALSTKDQLQPDQKYGFLLAPKGMPSKLEGRGDFLVEATELAISQLSQQENGFFLMVEGSQIDWESHASNVAGTVQEVRDFDKAIGAALDFAEKDGHTLVVVTADHETGGFALSPPLLEKTKEDGTTQPYWKYDTIAGSFYQNSKVIPGSAAHTASLIPVFAFGPGSEDFAGIYQNNEIFHKIVKAAGW